MYVSLFTNIIVFQTYLFLNTHTYCSQLLPNVCVSIGQYSNYIFLNTHTYLFLNCFSMLFTCMRLNWSIYFFSYLIHVTLYTICMTTNGSQSFLYHHPITSHQYRLRQLHDANHPLAICRQKNVWIAPPANTAHKLRRRLFIPVILLVDINTKYGNYYYKRSVLGICGR